MKSLNKGKWNDIDLRVKEFEDSLEIPNELLVGVEFVSLKKEDDLTKIPKKGGCYWIWTNEKINHSFHKHDLPKKVKYGEIIYNGISKDDIRGRIRKHLFGKVNEGLSAISVDLLLFEYKGSHRKVALSDKGNTAYLNNRRIRTKNEALNLNLSIDENIFVRNSDHPIHFRNGINITEKKHKDFSFKVYFLSNLRSNSYGDIVEKKWREKNHLPRLCTYKKGR